VKSIRLLIFRIKYLSLTLLLLASAGLSTPAWSQYGEYTLKAAFMEKFTHFIDWPNNPRNIFYVCIIGKNPFNGTLKSLAASSRIKNKPTKFMTLDNLNSLPDCNILFISKSKRKTLNEILNSVQNKPVLTISDTPGFAQHGVIINFVHSKDDNVQFEINHRVALNAGLKISSRLLKLAVNPVLSTHSKSIKNEDTE